MATQPRDRGRLSQRAAEASGVLARQKSRRPVTFRPRQQPGGQSWPPGKLGALLGGALCACYPGLALRLRVPHPYSRDAMGRLVRVSAERTQPGPAGVHSGDPAFGSLVSF